MSTVNVNRINDASGGVLAPISSVMRNRIINGSFTIDQRNAGASVTQTTANLFPVDRWIINGSVNSKFTAQQNAGSVTPPSGFTNYLGCTSSSAYSLLAGDYFLAAQFIEGFNTADLNFGTANAKTVTLSFWVRSSLTGTFGGNLSNSAENRSYPFSYTISVADTWEQKSVTIAGDTTGTWLTTNGSGIKLNFSLGMGSTYGSGTAGAWTNAWRFPSATSVVGTNGATFYITGVQLEVGTQATSFEYRQYQQELALCQRYFYLHASGTIRSGSVYTSISNVAQWDGSNFYGYVQFPTTMRSTPTIYQNTGASYYIQYVAGVTRNFSNFSFQDGSPTSCIIVGSSAGGTVGQAGWTETQNASALLAFTAEL